MTNSTNPPNGDVCRDVRRTRTVRTKGRKVKYGDTLIPRELQILRLMAEGLSDERIGKILMIAKDTVKTYNRWIFIKLGVNNRTQAVSRAFAPWGFSITLLGRLVPNSPPSTLDTFGARSTSAMRERGVVR